jgi:hypothetical protein
VWRGRVDLHDLTIRRDAFTHLGPLVVVRGHIGSLHLEATTFARFLSRHGIKSH